MTTATPRATAKMVSAVRSGSRARGRRNNLAKSMKAVLIGVPQLPPSGRRGDAQLDRLPTWLPSCASRSLLPLRTPGLRATEDLAQARQLRYPDCPSVRRQAPDADSAPGRAQ